MFQVWEKLKRNFGRVIAADMLGLGFSDKPVSITRKAVIFQQV